MTLRSALLFLFLLTIALPHARAQEVPPKYEFRGAWVATVTNLDWPVQGATPASQQAHLVRIFDGLAEAGVNAVVFQIRTEADALYDSDLEPWSYWLTGRQGQAPSPFYDPLAFAVEKAHERGMELHAWFNPYRAERSRLNYVTDAQHVTKAHPDWILRFGEAIGGLQLLNPGLPEVRDHVTNVIMDVVRRYDVDGVHFDDYFYPYPPNQITTQDQATFQEHSRGFSSIADWRRDNIDLLIEQVSDSIRSVKPHVKFGISPFGIWKSGVPPGIVGLSAYDTIYADATAWLDAGTIDYLAPQLYWAFGGGQDYARLSTWWATQMEGRHLYPGSIFRDTYSANEVPRQIRYSRALEGVQGTILFRSTFITESNFKGIADTLEQHIYRYPALPPVMEWKPFDVPGQPRNLTFAWTGDEEVTLSWEPAEEDTTWRYAVYRVRSAGIPDYEAAMQDARNLVAVTGRTQVTDAPGLSVFPYYYFVTGVGPNSGEGERSNSVALFGRAVSTETGGTPAAFTLDQNYPNPFNPSTEIRFTLERPADVALHVYDALGRVVATLLDGEAYPAGPHALTFDARADARRPLPSGTYFYALEADGQRTTKAMVLLK